MATLDPTFKRTLRRYGASDFTACYNCGTCTAVCNLSEKGSEFPRKLLRYGILGRKEEALADPAIWLCYACGECSESCPRGADPKNYMAALRRYAVARTEPTGLTRLLFTSNPFSILFTALLAVAFALFMMTVKPGQLIDRWIFAWMPEEIIHNLGLGLFVFLGLSMVVGGLSMLFRLFKGKKLPEKPLAALWGALGSTVVELVGMKRFRDCDADETSRWKDKPLVVKPWFVHLTIMWGFIGLLATTALDFLLKDPATLVWWPSRILGTISGLLMVYGATVSFIYRFGKVNKSYADSKLADWLFLGALWLAGVTGFWMEITVMADIQNSLNLAVFMIHTVVSMELVLLFAFSKFAHAIYRPLALFAHFYGRS